jgi:hypothetical protein
MTDPKPKGKTTIPTRTPGKKTNSGIFDNLRQLPHPVEEFLNPTRPSPTGPIPPQPDPTQPSPAQPIAPVKDYNKRANSIERALSEGLFPGTSQKLYNALYKRTRGAVVPARMIKATKRELMTWSGIKSKNTIAVNLKILTSIGWLKATVDPGDHEGNIYEVFIHEELTRPIPTQPKSSQPTPTHPDPTQKLGGDPTQKLGWDGLGNPVDYEGLYEPDKTLLKTKTEKLDDELRHSLAPLLEVARETTGREANDWREVAEVLATELRIAAGRTTISSVPAFLAEHLRRRLWKKEKRQIEEEGKSADVGMGTKLDPSACPDCFGTGMWYPQGFEKGVARCRHEKLTSEGPKQSG